MEPSGRVTVSNASLSDLVRNAYGLQRHETVPGDRLPSWVDSESWDIVAKGPEKPTTQQLRTMLQQLLIERFKLVTRREVRAVPVYAIVLARSDRPLGPRIRPTTADCDALAAAARAPSAAPGSARLCGRDIGGGRISGISVPLADLARSLSPITGRVVMDETGLSGRFDFELTWTPDQALGDGGAQSDGTSLFAALEEQLWFRLVPRTAPVNVFIIESAERPTED